MSSNSLPFSWPKQVEHYAISESEPSSKAPSSDESSPAGQDPAMTAGEESRGRGEGAGNAGGDGNSRAGVPQPVQKTIPAGSPFPHPVQKRRGSAAAAPISKPSSATEIACAGGAERASTPVVGGGRGSSARSSADCGIPKTPAAASAGSGGVGSPAWCWIGLGIGGLTDCEGAVCPT